MVTTVGGGGPIVYFTQYQNLLTTTTVYNIDSVDKNDNINSKSPLASFGEPVKDVSPSMTSG